MLILLGLAGLLFVSFPSASPVHPAAFALFAGDDAGSLECAPDLQPSTVDETSKPTRTANFRVGGNYRCRRPVFTAEERNPLFDEILVEETGRAPKVAAQVQALVGERPAGPIAVTVSGLGEVALEENIAALYRRELANVFVPGSVAHSALDPNGPRLEVRLRRTEEPSLMATARLGIPDRKGEVSWQEL